MAYYFVGGEDHDFSRIGVVSVNTATTAARRTANARCSLQVGSSPAATDGWQIAFGTTLTSFWHTGRFHSTTASNSNSHDLIAYLDGTTRRLIVHADGATHIRISKQDNAGTRTTLATSSNVFTNNTLYKLDVQVLNYGASATVNVYLDGTLWVTYTGDVTTNGSTSLSGVVHGHVSISGAGHWSEIIVTTDDTRNLGLVTLPPAANGNTFAWSNSYANVDETSTDDSDVCTSSAANEVMQTTVTSSGITGTPAIKAVCVAARATKGGAGPQNVQMMVRSAGADHVSSTIALPAAFNRVAHIWEANPATAGAWAYTDVTAAGFNIGLKSIA